MAAHNEARIVGYLIEDPKINLDENGKPVKIKMSLKTARRELDSCPTSHFENLQIYYDDKPLMQRLAGLSQFDVIDVKGVVTILPTNKSSICPKCGANLNLGPCGCEKEETPNKMQEALMKAFLNKKK